MTTEIGDARAALVAELDRAGYLPDPVWRHAFAQVPRHVFVPRFFLPTDDGRWQPIDVRNSEYLDRVYADTALTTQLDGAIDPQPENGPASGTSTSSSTQPSLMAYMLDALQVTGGERVREIGTGTGYNAALLCHRLGDANVTSVEVDLVIADRARARLAGCGYLPEVVMGDGGSIADGRYDRVIATCSVPMVPASWITHARDGGLIVTSLWRNLGGGPLVRLAVNDGTAQGFFLPQFGGFMPTRSVTPVRTVLTEALRQSGERRAAAFDSKTAARRAVRTLDRSPPTRGGLAGIHPARRQPAVLALRRRRILVRPRRNNYAGRAIRTAPPVGRGRAGAPTVAGLRRTHP